MQPQNGHPVSSSLPQPAPSSLAAVICCAIGVASLASERLQLLLSTLDHREQVSLESWVPKSACCGRATFAESQSTMCM